MQNLMTRDRFQGRKFAAMIVFLMIWTVLIYRSGYNGIDIFPEGKTFWGVVIIALVIVALGLAIIGVCSSGTTIPIVALLGAVIAAVVATAIWINKDMSEYFGSMTFEQLGWVILVSLAVLAFVAWCTSRD